MANKVCCEKTEVEQTKEMNDRDYLLDLLCSEKEITKNTCIALTEASNIPLHDEWYEYFTTVEAIQTEAYELAWNNGWYTLEEAEKTKISQKQKELQKKLDELAN